MSTTNPFRYGQIAAGEFFTDRAAEIERLVAEALAGQNTVIISPRRFGKTSVALRAREQLEQQHALVAYVDLFRAPTKQRLIDELGTALYRGLASPLDRARATARTVFRSLRLQPKITASQDGTPAVEFSPLALEEDQDRAIEQLLSIPEQFAVERKRRAVVMLDEVQEVISLDPNLPSIMRSLMQTQQHVAYVFLGSRHHLMTQVFTGRNQPLYRSARPIALGPIARDDFRQYIGARFQSTNVAIEADAIERILDITAGHPHDTQELCHFTWEITPPGGHVTTERVEHALRQVVAAEDARYTTLWDTLTRGQRALVLALARAPGKGQYSEAFRKRHQLGSVGTVQKSLKSLIERDIVEGSSVHGYRVPDVFFRAWIDFTLHV